MSIQKPLNANPQEGDLRIWWVPQVPCAAFEQDVPNIETARVVLDILAGYDDFQVQERIKGDYTNAGGLHVFEDGEWIEWRDPETDLDIDGNF